MFKFTVERDAFLTPLLLVAGAVEKRQTLPILSNILVSVCDNHLLLDATDTEIEFVARVPLSEVQEQGVTTVPAKKLIDICRALPSGILHFSCNDERVVIRSGKSRFTLSCLSAEDFPNIKDEVKDFEYSIEPSLLLQLFQSTHFSMAQQDVRYYLNGLLLDLNASKMVSVTTDGHRLAVSQVVTDVELPDRSFILPRKGVMELMRLLSDLDDEKVLMSVTKNHFYLQTVQYTLISKLIDGRFPNYQRVIPDDCDKSVTVERDELKKCLSRVSILANEKYRAVTLSVSPCKLTIMANNHEREEAVEELEGDTQGEEIQIGFNATYLLDVLSNVPAGLVKLSLSSPSSSMLVESLCDQTAQYVIMPMKI